MSKENPIPFYERVGTFAVNPLSASVDDVAKMAEELVEAFDFLYGLRVGEKLKMSSQSLAAWVARMEEMS